MHFIVIIVEFITKSLKLCKMEHLIYLIHFPKEIKVKIQNKIV